MPDLDHLSIIQNAVGLSLRMIGNPALGEGNYSEILSQFKMRVVNQNLLIRVRSEARAQSLFYFATRILVSRKWMDAKWFPYARNSGLVQVNESSNGQIVTYAGLMDIDGVLQMMLYFDGPVAHAPDAVASPAVAAFFQKLANGIQNIPSTVRDESEIYQIIGQRGDLFKQISDGTNQVFADGFLVD